MKITFILLIIIIVIFLIKNLCIENPYKNINANDLDSIEFGQISSTGKFEAGIKLKSSEFAKKAILEIKKPLEYKDAYTYGEIISPHIYRNKNGKVLACVSYNITSKDIIINKFYYKNKELYVGYYRIIGVNYVINSENYFKYLIESGFRFSGSKFTEEPKSK